MITKLHPKIPEQTQEWEAMLQIVCLKILALKTMKEGLEKIAEEDLLMKN